MDEKIEVFQDALDTIATATAQLENGLYSSAPSWRETLLLAADEVRALLWPDVKALVLDLDDSVRDAIEALLDADGTEEREAAARALGHAVDAVTEPGGE